MKVNLARTLTAIEVDGQPEFGRAASAGYRDLAPMIHRQRMVIEGSMPTPISDAQIVAYLSALSTQIGMVELLSPVTHRSDRYGWAGWIHWETSGAHFYAWEDPILFFSVDIYTCKPFDPERATALTRDFFHASELATIEF